MTTSNSILWSNERRKWLCYDDKLIDYVLNSRKFAVPTYDYSNVEAKFNKNFASTKNVISHFPLANEGVTHLYLRDRMSNDLKNNLKKAINVFKETFEQKISRFPQSSDPANIAAPIVESILKSNWIFANLDLENIIDYSDLTLMLDDSQSLKSRLLREEFIKSIALKIDERDRFYKIALISVGVNALISTTLHSFVKILTNYDFNNLISRKFFYSNGIKHLERVCIENTILHKNQINAGERLRLYVENYEFSSLSDSQMNKKFFAMESDHSCIGMNYSLSIWKELINIIKNNFTDLRIINFDYRSNDAIFNFPSNIIVEYKKCNQ
jgi:hypothetical protein